jgi:hypothetical protein
MTEQKNSRSFTINYGYLRYCDEVNKDAEEKGPHFVKVLRSSSQDMRPGFVIVVLGNMKGYNPITKQQFDLDPDAWVQRYHKDSEQFGMTAIDAAIKAASQAVGE